MKHIWIFTGNKASFPAGAFETKEQAEEFINKYKLSGTLTKYPVGTSLYDWTIEKDYFNPTKDYQKSSNFIQSFNSAYTEHYHYDQQK